jgi:chromosome partitioning protein
MPVIVVLNRKGGSGKSTLATHLAAYAANQRMSVMLGDMDKQQSSRLWLNLRQKITKNTMPPIVHWVRGGEGRLPTPPGNHTLLVIDTPGGLQGLELAKVVMMADAILIPVCDALFDRNSAADCIAELKLLPRIRTQRCSVSVVAMRIDSHVIGSVKRIAQWANEQGIEFIGHLRHANMYVSCIEKGLTLFDAPPPMVAFDLKQWKPILESLKPLFDSMQQEKNALFTAASNKQEFPLNGAQSHLEEMTFESAVTLEVPHRVSSNVTTTHNLADIHRINANLAALVTTPMTSPVLMPPLQSQRAQTTTQVTPAMPLESTKPLNREVEPTIESSKKGFFASLGIPDFLRK